MHCMSVIEVQLMFSILSAPCLLVQVLDVEKAAGGVQAGQQQQQQQPDPAGSHVPEVSDLGPLLGPQHPTASPHSCQSLCEHQYLVTTQQLRVEYAVWEACLSQGLWGQPNTLTPAYAPLCTFVS
jgi:hypothetical protein